MTRIDANRKAFLQTVKQTVAEYELLSHGDSVLVGLSGGADSVALLLALYALRDEYALTLSCAHVNHGLRGEAAHRDMEFVRAFCEKLSVPLFVLEEDVAAYAQEKQLSIEAAGREIRYRFFGKQHTDKIAVAHNKNDCAETMLMNVLKGNLPMGIPPKRDNIIRPLLGVCKDEIYTFLEECGQDFVTDESNFSKEYTRNRIRLDLVPYLAENFNKNFTNTVYNTCDVMWQEQKYLEEITNGFLEDHALIEEAYVSVCAKAVADTHPAIARKAVRQCYYLLSKDSAHISYEQIERLLSLCKTGQSGQRVELSGEIDGILSGEKLVFFPRQKKISYSYQLTQGQWTEVPEIGYLFCLAKQPSEDCLFSYPIVLNPSDEVIVRSRKNGDKIYFQNCSIHKKISDFLSEHKVPLWERDRIALVAVNDAVRIVVGHFFESVSSREQNQHYILVKKQEKGI